jgi:hypothetical protein
MMVAKASDFTGTSGRRKLTLPSIFVSKNSKASTASRAKRKTAFNVDSLEKLVDAFDENERSLKAPVKR